MLVESTGKVYREIVAGLLVACIAIPGCMAPGVLLFGALGKELASKGAIIGVIAAVVAGIVGSLLRRSSFLLTTPTTPIALVQASLLAQLMQISGLEAEAAIVAIAICTFLGGFWQLLIGATGLARFIRQVPYPIIAGFVSGIGILIVFNELKVLFNDIPWALLGSQPFPWHTFGKPLFGICLIAAMLLSSRRLPQVPSTVVGLLVGSSSFYFLRWLLPSLNLGNTVGTIEISAITWFSPSNIGALWHKGDYALWQAILGSSLTLALMGCLDTLFTLRIAQNTGEITIDQDRDLMAQGAANFASAAIGGLFVSISLPFTMINYQLGGRSRLSTLATVFFMGLGVIVLPDLLAAIPLVVLAALLIVVGVNTIDKWMLKTFYSLLRSKQEINRPLALRSIFEAMAVGLATVFGHPVMGAILGFVLSCMIFIFEINRPNVGLTDHMTIAPSKRMRSLKQQEVLAATAHERVLITLRGILFFGTAGQLISKVEALDSSVRVIILDFHKVINAGISGVAALQQVARQLERQNRKLYISGLSNADPTWGSDSLPPGVFFFGSSDDALEYAEDEALVSIGREIGKEIALDQTDFGAIMSVSELTILKEHLRRVTFKQGETLCREGEPSDCLWVLVKGSVGIWASSGSQRHRINSIGLGCIVGEMGLLDQQPRFADAVADEDIAAYELTREQLADLLRMHPFIGQALLQDIIRQLTHRLRRLSQIDD